MLHPLRPALALLLMFCTASVRAGGLFDAPKPPLIYSDRQQPLLRLQRVWSRSGVSGKGNYYDASAAMPLPLYSDMHASSTGFFMNAVLGAAARFGLSAPDGLYASEYTGGLSMVNRSYSGDIELYVYRRGSHLGDSAIYGNYGYEQRTVSRDVVRLLYFSTPESFFPGAYGGSYILGKTPSSPSGRFSLQYSMEVPVSRNAFIGGTFVVSQEYAWALDSNLQAGVRLGSDKNDTRRPALVLEYHNGASPYGQFYAGKENTLSLGFVGAL